MARKPNCGKNINKCPIKLWILECIGNKELTQDICNKCSGVYLYHEVITNEKND